MLAGMGAVREQFKSVLSHIGISEDIIEPIEAEVLVGIHALKFDRAKFSISFVEFEITCL
ncbi:hypothetical protein DFR44_10417 [Hydromonas duriensis]|uniref:Uncharacterized protein n=1 Tax=Hydromonas duriensis TaxID=1527608 RepID=A0A4R6Y9U9_9BURK|nr:hypothetical protein DFR44_10417 [Hydromonas duriensis]